jgi:hypothetical protein
LSPKALAVIEVNPEPIAASEREKVIVASNLGSPPTTRNDKRSTDFLHRSLADAGDHPTVGISPLRIRKRSGALIVAPYEWTFVVMPWCGCR